MLYLPPIIERIKALLAEGTGASLTYAALEARLALEKVVYDQLRQRHDYISHDQLKRWQPGAVVTTLMQEVDPYVTKSMTVSIGSPVDKGIKPDEDDYIAIGTEVGFDAKRVARMWQALANLALHVRLPRHKEDHIPDYGDMEQIRVKVEEVIVEIERLSKGTMTSSGIPLGGEVSFDCECGEKNRRRAALLQAGQVISCINPDCKSSWKVHIKGGKYTFEPQMGKVNCEKCKAVNQISWRLLRDMKYDQIASFNCVDCDHQNFIQWRLKQVRPARKRGPRK